jgi:prepilin-type N-terminal cleavage/methylation domain-containing protein
MNRQPPRLISAPHPSAAFTLVEVVVAIALVGIGIATVVTALTSLNSSAAVNRNFTGALSAGTYQIDKALCDAPFKPTAQDSNGNYMIPPVLTVGTTTENNVPVYQDPATGTVVSGTRTTDVTAPAGVSFNGSTVTVYQVTTTVSYTYRNRNYSYSMSTLRTPDE